MDTIKRTLTAFTERYSFRNLVSVKLAEYLNENNLKLSDTNPSKGVRLISDKPEAMPYDFQQRSLEAYGVLDQQNNEHILLVKAEENKTDVQFYLTGRVLYVKKETSQKEPSKTMFFVFTDTGKLGLDANKKDEEEVKNA